MAREVYVILGGLPGPAPESLLAEAIDAQEGLGLTAEEREALLASVRGCAYLVEVEDAAGAGVRVGGEVVSPFTGPSHYRLGPFTIEEPSQ